MSSLCDPHIFIISRNERLKASTTSIFAEAITTKETAKLLATGLLWGESIDDRWIPSQRPVMWKVFPCYDINMVNRILMFLLMPIKSWIRFNHFFMSNHVNASWWRHQMKTFSALLAFVRGIHRSPVNYPHKGQWRGNLIFSLICAWTNGWGDNRSTGDLRRHRAQYDVIVVTQSHVRVCQWIQLRAEERIRDRELRSSETAWIISVEDLWPSPRAWFGFVQRR